MSNKIEELFINGYSFSQIRIIDNTINSKNFLKKVGLKNWEEYRELYRIYKRRREQKERNNAGFINKNKIKKYYDNKCFFCENKSTTIHHIIGFKFSKNNNIDNLIPVCKECHDILHFNAKLERKDCLSFNYEYIKEKALKKIERKNLEMYQKLGYKPEEIEIIYCCYRHKPQVFLKNKRVI